MILDCDGGYSIAWWCTARRGTALLVDILLSTIRTRAGGLADGMSKGSLASNLSAEKWL